MTSSEEIIEGLKSQDAAIRSQAVHILGEKGAAARKALPVLISMLLNDSAANVRERAAWAIGQIGDSSGGDSLAALAKAVLRDSSKNVRMTALISLPNIDDKFAAVIDKVASGDIEQKIISYLVLSLKNPDRAGAATFVIETIGLPALDTLCRASKDADSEYSSKALGLILKINPNETAIPILIEALKNPGAAEAAAGALVTMGFKAIPALFEALKTSSGEARSLIIKSIVLIGPQTPEAVPILIEAIKKSELSEAAAATLVKTGQPAVPALIKAAGDDSGGVRNLIVKSIVHIGPKTPDAIPILIEAVKNPELSEAAVSLLVKTGQPAVPALLEAVKDKDSQARTLMIKSIVLIGPKTTEALPILINSLKDPLLCDHAISAISKVGSAVLPYLKKTLNTCDSEIQPYLSWIISFYCVSNEEKIPLIVNALKAKSLQIRLEAVKSLGALGANAKTALPALMLTQNDENTEIHEAADKAIISIKTDVDAIRSRSISFILGLFSLFVVPSLLYFLIPWKKIFKVTGDYLPWLSLAAMTIVAFCVIWLIVKLIISGITNHSDKKSSMTQGPIGGASFGVDGLNITDKNYSGRLGVFDKSGKLIGTYVYKNGVKTEFIKGTDKLTIE